MVLHPAAKRSRNGLQRRIGVRSLLVAGRLMPQNSHTPCALCSRISVLARLFALIAVACFWGHFVAQTGRDRGVVEIAQLCIEPWREGPGIGHQVLLPLTSIASDASKYILGSNSRFSRLFEAWYARTLASARALQAARDDEAAEPSIEMNEGEYSIRWHFLGPDGSKIDLSQARTSAQLWLNGSVGSSVQRVPRPTFIQFELVVRTVLLQSSGFDGYVRRMYNCLVTTICVALQSVGRHGLWLGNGWS